MFFNNLPTNSKKYIPLHFLLQENFDMEFPTIINFLCICHYVLYDNKTNQLKIIKKQKKNSKGKKFKKRTFEFR